MKTKEEIKSLGNQWALDNADETMATNSALNKGFRGGYTQCQKDMAYNFLSLIEEFKEKELPNRNIPYHYEAEISAGLGGLINFIKNKQD